MSTAGARTSISSSATNRMPNSRARCSAIVETQAVEEPEALLAHEATIYRHDSVACAAPDRRRAGGHLRVRWHAMGVRRGRQRVGELALHVSPRRDRRRDARSRPSSRPVSACARTSRTSSSPCSVAGAGPPATSAATSSPAKSRGAASRTRRCTPGSRPTALASAGSALDPTTGRLADERYVPVGRGRDYDDVRPVRGVLRGAKPRQHHESRLQMVIAEQ